MANTSKRTAPSGGLSRSPACTAFVTSCACAARSCCLPVVRPRLPTARGIARTDGGSGQGGCGDGHRAATRWPGAPQGRHRPRHRRRQGGRHPRGRRLDDGRARNDEHALPQRRGGDLLCVDTAADPRRREHGAPRRQAVEMAAGRAERRPGHARTAGPNDVRLRRLRHRQHRIREGAVRGPVPAVGTRPASRLRDEQAAALRAGHELELRPHQLRAAGQGAGEGDRRGHAEVVGRQGASAPRTDQHRQLVHTADPGTGRCTRSPANAAQHCKYPAAHRFTRSRPIGIRRGRSPTAPSRRPTSTTWRPARSDIGSGKLLSKESYEAIRVDRSARQDPDPSRLRHLRGA